MKTFRDIGMETVTQENQGVSFAALLVILLCYTDLHMAVIPDKRTWVDKEDLNQGLKILGEECAKMCHVVCSECVWSPGYRQS